MNDLIILRSLNSSHMPVYLTLPVFHAPVITDKIFLGRGKLINNDLRPLIIKKSV